MAYPKVAVVGAGHVGATAALMLLLKDLADVVLVDVAEGLPQGKALDMMHARSVERFGCTVVGSNDYAATSSSDVVVVTAGLPRKPGMTRDDLLVANADVVRSVVPKAVEASPEAILLCVTNPLDVMTYLAWKESGLDSARVLGMGGVLDSARFAYAIAQETGASADRIEAVVIGSHGDQMVPVPSLSTVDGVALPEALSADRVQAVVERTVFGGAEVVSLLKTGSAYFAPGAAVVAMVHAILTDARAKIPSCVLLNDRYGLDDLYLSVPAVVGHAGVLEVPEVPLESAELAALKVSGDAVIESLRVLELRD